jgi:C4-dicarboxylate transporter DctQ subunit
MVFEPVVMRASTIANGVGTVLQRAISILEKILFGVASLGLLVSISLAFTAVVLRYIFNHSLEWIEEAARYLALMAAFLVAGPVLRNRGHVALDLLPASLGHVQFQIHRLIVGIFALVVSAFVFLWSTELVQQTLDFGLLTGSLQFPQWLPYSIVPLGMAFLILFSVIEIFSAIGEMRAGPSGTGPGDTTGARDK